MISLIILGNLGIAAILELKALYCHIFRFFFKLAVISLDDKPLNVSATISDSSKIGDSLEKTSMELLLLRFN